MLKQSSCWGPSDSIDTFSFICSLISFHFGPLTSLLPFPQIPLRDCKNIELVENETKPFNEWVIGHRQCFAHRSNWFGDVRRHSAGKPPSSQFCCKLQCCRAFVKLLKLCSTFFVLRSGLDHLLSPSPPSRFVVKMSSHMGFTFFCRHFQRYFFCVCVCVFFSFITLFAAQHIDLVFCCISGDLHQRKQRHSAIQERKGECWGHVGASRVATEPKTNLTSASSFEQGTRKITFQLEVWSKTEDVVQTLLQVRTVWNGRSDKGRVLTACIRYSFFLF